MIDAALRNKNLKRNYCLIKILIITFVLVAKDERCLVSLQKNTELNKILQPRKDDYVVYSIYIRNYTIKLLI